MNLEQALQAVVDFLHAQWPGHPDLPGKSTAQMTAEKAAEGAEAPPPGAGAPAADPWAKPSGSPVDQYAPVSEPVSEPVLEEPGLAGSEAQPALNAGTVTAAPAGPIV